MVKIILTIILILVLFFLVVMVIDGNRFTVKTYKLATEKTKHSHKFVILADLHGKEYGYQNEKLLKAIEEQNPTGILIAGDMLTAVITENAEISHSWCDWIQPKEKQVDKETALLALKNFNAWRKAGGKDFLHLGKMIKPLPIVCGKNSFIAEDGRKVTVDEVLTSAYEYDGRKLQFIANYNLHPVTVSLPKSVTLYKNPEMTDIEYEVGVIEIPALSAVAVEV